MNDLNLVLLKVNELCLKSRLTYKATSLSLLFQFYMPITAILTFFYIFFLQIIKYPPSALSYCKALL